MKLKTQLEAGRKPAPAPFKVSLFAGAALIAAVAPTNASPDYGPAIWNPPCNANYNTTGSGHKFHVIHDIEGYYLGCISMFKACGYTSASIHYVVNGKKDNASDAAAGEVTQMVRDANYAWHARCWNSHCTGTEHEGFASNPAWFTPELYAASAGVTRNLASKFGWAKDRNHVIGHGQKSVAGWAAYASANLGIDPNCNTHTDPGPYWDWSGYMSLVNSGGAYHWGNWYKPVPGFAASGPFVVSHGPGQFVVFMLGGGNTLYHATWNGSAWSSWMSLGGGISSGASAISRAPGMIDVVARGTDNQIKMRSFNGTTWNNWYNIGSGTFTSAPTIVDSQDGFLNIWAQGTDNQLYQAYWNGSSWVGWGWLGAGQPGMASGSAPTAISRGPGSVDLAIRGTDYNIWMRHFNGGAWGSWYVPVPGGSLFDAGLCNTGGGKLSMFIIGGDNRTYEAKWNGSSWVNWAAVGTAGYGNATPSACMRSGYPGLIDLCIRGGDNDIYFNHFSW